MGQKLVVLGYEFVAGLLTQSSHMHMTVMRGLPYGAELVHSYFDPGTSRLYLKFQHEKFGPNEPLVQLERVEMTWVGHACEYPGSCARTIREVDRA